MELAKIIVKETTGKCILYKRIPAGIVGATVSVEFASPVWANLQKTVVFRGAETKIAEFDGKVATVPHEVVATPGFVLFFGIWGNDPDSGLQLPLIEVRMGIIEDATDPEADPGTDPSLPVWAQLQAEIKDLKENGVSDEKIAQAVEDYLIKNPIEGGNGDFKTDETLILQDGVLSVNTAKEVTKDDSRPITSGAVYDEFSKAVALLKTI